MRHTKSHTKNRRSHHALKSTGLVKCKNCDAPKKSHTVCKTCGVYRGNKVLDLVKKAEKKAEKAKAKTSE